MRKIAIALTLVPWSVAAQANMFEARSAAAAPKADAFFSPSGHDSEGHAIGADCTYASPCRTVEKALSFLAQNIARAGGVGAGTKYNYKLLFDGAAGPFYLQQTALYTTAHTVDPGFTTTFDVYNGAQAEWSGGRDIAGTWRPTKLPNGTGAAACVSDALAGSAPADRRKRKALRRRNVDERQADAGSHKPAHRPPRRLEDNPGGARRARRLQRRDGANRLVRARIRRHRDRRSFANWAGWRDDRL